MRRASPMVSKLFVGITVILVAVVAGAVIYSTFFSERVSGFQIKAAQAEAKSLLKGAWAVMETLGRDRGDFRQVTLEEVAKGSEKLSKRYVLSFEKVEKDDFLLLVRAEAGAMVECAWEDVWVMSRDRKVTHVQDGSRGC